MSGLERKRGREEEEEEEEEYVCGAKRFQGLSAGGKELLDLLDIDSMERNLGLEDQDCEAAEDLLNGVMRSLEEEIGVARCCSSDSSSPNHSNAQPVAEEPRCLESSVDLGYLLEASDDELGIPPTCSDDPAVGVLPDEQCSSDESCAGLLETPAVQGCPFDPFWQFEDDATAGYNLLEFLYPGDSTVNRPQEFEGREFVNPCVLFEHPEAEHSLSWRHEAACGI